MFFYSHDTNTKSFWHFKFIFSKIQNKENKYMYTNTSKIEYILYKIYTGVMKSSPIYSFCPWWCSEGLTAEPVEMEKRQSESLFCCILEKKKVPYIILSYMNWIEVQKRSYTTANGVWQHVRKLLAPVNGSCSVPCQTSETAIIASWSCDQAATRYWTTSGPVRRAGMGEWEITSATVFKC